MVRIICAISLLVLGACATPQDRCLRQGTYDLRTVNRLIQETERDLARGYTYETELNPVSIGVGYCTGYSGTIRFCGDTGTDTIRRAVPIDAEQKQRELAELKRKQAELQNAAAPRIASCQARYPS
ncbi:hypothetical protein [Qingshengfaniella alkalisoli]|uniref:Uncharacterized protein n=1 Tax=Qingshengfaniella alkalisoli TaxID=2599296 RepID=A0A5B8J2Z8_9RHOB|nr:hypothetical protein [Qingshengfaniella alkalisoli]QDY68640.1 hypothetical protein FPZ52_02730 [Qingshengfaniella alkalisoli]